jgi:hypothetical protein
MYDAGEQEERLTYQELAKILETRKHTHYLIPMMIVTNGPSILEYLLAHNIQFANYTGPKDKVQVLLVDISEDKLSILSTLSEDSVYFQTPDELEPCEVLGE